MGDLDVLRLLVQDERQVVVSPNVVVIGGAGVDEVLVGVVPVRGFRCCGAS